MSDQNEDLRLGGKRKKRGPLPEAVQARQKQHRGAHALVNLAVIGFLGYGLYTFMQQGGDAGMISELGNRLAVIDAPKNQDPRVDSLHAQQQFNALQHMMPVERVAVGRKTLQEGKGDPVMCGQQVTYRLIEGLGEKRKVSEPRQMRLGSRDAVPGLTLGLEGMRVGEVRELTIPTALWENKSSTQAQTASDISLMVELQSMDTQIPQSALPLRRFPIQFGTGHPTRCGDLVVAHLAVWGSDGKLVFSTQHKPPVYFFTGDGSVPYGLERGVLEMAPGGIYSLVLAPEYLAPLVLGSKPAMVENLPYDVQPFPADLKFPSGQMVLVDIEIPAKLPEKTPKKLSGKPLPTSQSPVTQPVIQPKE